MPSSIKSPPAQKSRLRESMWGWPSEIQAWVSPTMCSPTSSSLSSLRKDQEKDRVSDFAQVVGFAKQSGGGVALKTRVGEGTSVTVFLPCGEVVRRVRERESGIEQISTVELKPCILVVDDDQAVLRSTVRVLEAVGYAAVPAASGQEALELIANGLKIELVLADFAMPEMTGVELAKAICATRPNLPVILVTGYGDRESLEEFQEAQILRKPYDEDGLMKAILAALT